MILNKINKNYYNLINNLQNEKINIKNLSKEEKGVISYLKIISKYNNIFLEDKLIEKDIKNEKIKIILEIWQKYKVYFDKINNNNFFEYKIIKTKQYKLLKNINYFIVGEKNINIIKIKLIFIYLDDTKDIIIISFNDLLRIKKLLSLTYINCFGK